MRGRAGHPSSPRPLAWGALALAFLAGIAAKVGFDARYAHFQATHERQLAAMADEGDLVWDQMLGLRQRLEEGRLTPNELLGEVQFPPASDRVTSAHSGTFREIVYDAPHYGLRTKFTFPISAPA